MRRKFLLTTLALPLVALLALVLYVRFDLRGCSVVGISLSGNDDSALQPCHFLKHECAAEVIDTQSQIPLVSTNNHEPDFTAKDRTGFGTVVKNFRAVLGQWKLVLPKYLQRSLLHSRLDVRVS